MSVGSVSGRRFIGGLLLSACLVTAWGGCLSSCTGKSDAPSPTGTAVTRPLPVPDSPITLPTPEILTVEPAETVPCPPVSRPDPEGDYTELLISSFYAAGVTAEKAWADASFVELYNGSDLPLSLSGMALYVSDNGQPFTEHRFLPDAVIPAKGHYLIRCASVPGEDRPVLKLNDCDVSFPVKLNPDGVRLAVAPSGRSWDAEKPLGKQAAVSGLSSYVSSHPLDASDRFHYTDRLSEKRLIRKAACGRNAFYTDVDLTQAPTTVLSAVCPCTSRGKEDIQVRAWFDEVTFSRPGGVYREPFDLTLSAPEGYTVYYTVNGDDPAEAISATVCTDPIHLSDTTEMLWGTLTKACVEYLGPSYRPLQATFPGAWVIKARAVRESDGAVCPLVTQSYLIGQDFADFGVDTLCLSLNGESFIGTKGIYNGVAGRETDKHPHIPAYVEFLSPEGDRVFEGPCEIAMNGKGSLGMTQKSFRVLLKSHFADGSGAFPDTLNYDLFRDYASVTPDGERVTWYRHLLFRNGGGDMSGSPISRSHIGDAFIQRLDRFLKPDIMAYAPVMVYINGEFFGLFNARDRLDTKYFAGKYGIPEEDFSMLECPYPLKYGWNVDYTAAYGDPAEAESFMDIVRFAVSHDLSDPEAYRYIEERVDLDGLIDFFCAQIYLCCSDWPSNNIKVWRSTKPHGMTDTKWHFCIVDTDHGMGLNSSPETNLWGAVSDVSVIGRLVHHLMDHPAFRELFFMRYIFCTEVYFTPERLHRELEDLVSKIRPVMGFQLDRWRVTDGSRTDWDTWYSYIETIHRFADERPAFAKAQFQAFSGLSEEEYGKLLEKSLKTWADEREMLSNEPEFMKKAETN